MEEAEVVVNSSRLGDEVMRDIGRNKQWLF
jgi:hypothetical protein